MEGGGGAFYGALFCGAVALLGRQMDGIGGRLACARPRAPLGPQPGLCRAPLGILDWGGLWRCPPPFPWTLCYNKDRGTLCAISHPRSRLGGLWPHRHGGGTLILLILQCTLLSKKGLH